MPYRHAVVDGFLDDGSARAVREQLRGFLGAEFKETDLFKVWQTGDLAVLDDLQDDSRRAAVADVLRLRAALYSASFRGFVERVSGCPPLSARVDCAANAYSTGCHLLCHDDVIGTRAVSYILYLTDPEDTWTADDGGALELYPQLPGAPAGTPAPIPTASLLPLFNRLAFFVVEPGMSFHAVQEVFSRGKHRFSLQGWYHTDRPPADADRATLAQLTEASRRLRPRPVAFSFDRLNDFHDEDAALLAEFVNSACLRRPMMEVLRKEGARAGRIQIHQFLNARVARRLRQLTLAADARDGVGLGRPPRAYDVGAVLPWTLVGPPHMQRFVELDATAAGAVGDGDGEGPAALAARLIDLRVRLFQSSSFVRWLHALLPGLVFTAGQCSVRRFRPGLDYTVAHYGAISQQDEVETVLTLAAPASAAAAASSAAAAGSAAPATGDAQEWSGGDVGGYLCYVFADEDSETARASAEVYRGSSTSGGDGGDVVSLPAADNMFAVVVRRRNQLGFVKYVSAQAPASRWDIHCEFLTTAGAADDSDTDLP